MICRFLKDESGATAIDYGILAALIAIGCIVTLDAMGTSVSRLLEYVTGKISARTPK